MSKLALKMAAVVMAGMMVNGTAWAEDAADNTFKLACRYNDEDHFKADLTQIPSAGGSGKYMGMRGYFWPCLTANLLVQIMRRNS